jgi:hypothetical protein
MAGGYTVAGKIPEFSDGFAVRMMWQANGQLVFYVYHHDQQIIYGSTWDWEGFKFVQGRWYNLTIRLVLNSVTNGKGNNDGILEGYVNGTLKFKKTI